MTGTFNALVLRENGEDPKAPPIGSIEQLTDTDLPAGDVTIDVDYSSLNYKDGLALTGAGRIVRSFPMVPGIDLAGTVVASETPDYAVGDGVILTSWGMGERFWGGYAERQRVSSEFLVALPAGMTSLDAMAVGTAGLTAMLCVAAIEDAGVTPADGPVIVTGAAGGVGSLSVRVARPARFRGRRGDRPARDPRVPRSTGREHVPHTRGDERTGPPAGIGDVGGRGRHRRLGDPRQGHQPDEVPRRRHGMRLGGRPGPAHDGAAVHPPPRSA